MEIVSLQNTLQSISLEDEDENESNTKIPLDQLPSKLDELKHALFTIYPRTKKTPLIAEWKPDLYLSQLKSTPNKIIEKMGLRSSDKIHFLPEETLYLIQRGDMCLTYLNQIQSIEQAYILLGINLHRFLVYTQLKQNGFIVAHSHSKFKCPNPLDSTLLQNFPSHAFDVWKPRPQFKLSQPPTPDFFIFIDEQKKGAVPKSIPEGPGQSILAFSDQGIPVFYEMKVLGSSIPLIVSDKEKMKQKPSQSSLYVRMNEKR